MRHRHSSATLSDFVLCLVGFTALRVFAVFAFQCEVFAGRRLLFLFSFWFGFFLFVFVLGCFLLFVVVVVVFLFLLLFFFFFVADSVVSSVVLAPFC